VGFAARGQCYATSTEAMAAWGSDGPQFAYDAQRDVATTVSLGSGSVDAAGLVTGAVLVSENGGAFVSKALRAQLSPCSPTNEQLTLAEVFSVPDVGLASEAWAAGFVVPVALALLAWAIRVILEQLNQNHG